MRLDKPTSLSEALKKFLDRYPHQKKLRQGMVLAKWGEVVGPKIAEQTHDVYFQGSILTVWFQMLFGDTKFMQTDFTLLNG